MTLTDTLRERLSSPEMRERVARAIIVTVIPSYEDASLWRDHWSWYLEFRGEGGSADHSTLAEADRQAAAALAEIAAALEE
jgi:hypothetical protein